jgi:4-hydroxybenzoyl-CoA thioesterase
MSSKFERQIAWGDCDAAGIVYFPRYFYWMDTAFQTMLGRAGMSHRSLIETYGVNIPIVDAGAKFFSSATYDDQLSVDANIVHWGNSSFKVGYKGARDGQPIFEGHEVRVWSRIAADGTIASMPIAPEFKAAITALGK